MKQYAYKTVSGRRPQFTKRVIAVRPTAFAFDEECAQDDVFQHKPSESIEVLTKKASHLEV